MKNLIKLFTALALLVSVSAQSGEKIYFVQSDHLGTPEILTDQNQNIVWRAGQDPFGDSIPTVEQITFNIRFPGQYYDQETGLHYNWNRYYDPEIGRYVTSDPVGLEGGLNTYGYVLGNPLRYTDPTGEQAAVAEGLGGFCAANPGVCGAGGAISSGAAACASGLFLLLFPSSLADGTCGDNGCSTDDDEDSRCDDIYYNIDIPVCRGISRKRGSAAAQRCYASASERYAACLAGRPMPELDTRNN